MSLPSGLKVARGSLKMACLTGFLWLFLPGTALPLAAQTPVQKPDTLHWVHQASDPKLWEEIRQKFNEELTPEQATAEKSAIDTYGYNYLQMAGTFGHSALVIVGHRPAKEVTKDN